MARGAMLVARRKGVSFIVVGFWGGLMGWVWCVVKQIEWGYGKEGNYLEA
jgi:hypothetical protein